LLQTLLLLLLLLFETTYQSRCRFGTQHNGISTVVYGGCDVRRFGAGRRGTLDHGFQHLRGNDDRLALLPALVDDVLLEDRNVLWWAFDSQIL
jgi:hypothetical protein